jgi:hypothetical protein
MRATTARTMKTRCALATIVAALGAGSAVHAVTVGSEGFTVPPLSCFGTVATMKYDMTSVTSDLSGITYNPETGTLFAVNNGDRIVYEIQFPNTLVNQWDVSSVSQDLEGISALGGRKFAITDENPATVYQVTLNPGSTSFASSTLGQGITPAAGSNLGFEGVAYIGAPVNKFYTIQEASPSKLWKLDAPSGGTITAQSGDLEASPYKITSVGGLTRGGDETDELFLVVKNYNATGRNNEIYAGQKGIFRYNISTDTFTERFGGEVCTMGQPEGLTFWKNSTTNKIMMLIVGETNEARVYEADPTCTDSIGSVSTLMATCAKKEISTSACEKTQEDGGCPWTRCDKSLTDHTKICTDDVPGTTDCSEAQCKAYCTNNGFTGSNTGKTCTHWAYDVAEKECYIFAGCNNAKFDADYTTYITQDPTCERTLEDYPLGCETRRCDKTMSTHNKICVKTTPGTTDCTLAECKAKCQAHTDFTCTTYAYDVAERECYLFETCVNEGYDADYSTYVLQDPTCDKNKTEGGCVQRRCNKDLMPTTHEKVCVDDSPAQQCTMAQCEYKCANKTFTNIDSEAYCTHWAYDVVDKECYLFYGCTGEAYDDDYTLYTQSYGERTALIAAGEPAPPAPPPTTTSATMDLVGPRAAAFSVLVAVLVAALFA